KRKSEIRIFVALLADIQKALAPKPKLDPRILLPKAYRKYLKLFLEKKADKLLPLQGPGINHYIKLKKINRKDPKLTLLLEKGFIYVSNSLAIVLVLFIYKFSRGLYFYINYYTLNKISKKNKYSLPLIYKTLS
ncbi:hypothetical protein K469DRAFT_760085, partial [Zopfia rhizophila CBS 207.26]